MKILHINCADCGSTGKIIEDISNEATKQGHQSFLCTALITHSFDPIQKFKTSLSLEQGFYRRLCWYLGFPQFGFAPLSTARILRHIKRIRPDVVHLHSINCNMVNIYKLVNYLKRNRIATVVTNHAEFFYTGSCAHAYSCDKWQTGCGSCDTPKSASMSLWDTSRFAWKKMKKSFAGFEKACVVSVSPFINDRSVRSPILAGIPHKTVMNGINTDIFSPQSSELTKSLRDTAEQKLILCVTARFDPTDDSSKGGKYLVELAKRFKGEPVKFLVAGSAVQTKDSLPDNLILLGMIKDQNVLAQYYSAADLSIITSRRETFSMPVAESLCCGTPIIGFRAGGPESIAIDAFCEFTEFGNVDNLEQMIRKQWLQKKSEIGSSHISSAAAEIYAGHVMAQKYINIYRELCSKT